MAASSNSTSVPSEYMSGRGKYWSIIRDPKWPGLTAVRFVPGTKEINKAVAPILANDFPSLAVAIEKFETDEAKMLGETKPPTLQGGVAKTESSGAMADSTKLMLVGLGIGVLGIGAYFMMRKSSGPSSVRFGASRPLAESDDDKERRFRALSDLEKRDYLLNDARAHRLHPRPDQLSYSSATPGYWTNKMRDNRG